MTDLKAPVVPARVRILETAMRLFYRHGVRATGIDRIISEAAVAKMSFYRHFPSKDDLVAAFLEERHVRWMSWFEERTGAKRRRGANLPGVADALEEWFCDPAFRGCAFINMLAESPEIPTGERMIAMRHKSELAGVLARLAHADGVARPEEAGALALVVVDGAIVRAQMTGEGKVAASSARQLLKLIVARG